MLHWVSNQEGAQGAGRGPRPCVLGGEGNAGREYVWKCAGWEPGQRVLTVLTGRWGAELGSHAGVGKCVRKGRECSDGEMQAACGCGTQTSHWGEPLALIWVLGWDGALQLAGEASPLFWKWERWSPVLRALEVRTAVCPAFHLW